MFFIFTDAPSAFVIDSIPLQIFFVFLSLMSFFSLSIDSEATTLAIGSEIFCPPAVFLISPIKPFTSGSLET